MTARWLLYALGGGMGHVTRTMALARRAAHAGQESVVLSNSALAQQVQFGDVLPLGVTLRFIDANAGRAEVAASVATEVGREVWASIVVDTFPRGLGGELPAILDSLDVPKVLVHRFVCEAYLRKPGVWDAGAAFDKILIPGEQAPLSGLPQATFTKPWLLLDAKELNTPTEARNALSVPLDGLPLIVVVGCGTNAEIVQMKELASRLDKSIGTKGHLRFAAPSQHWPLLRQLPGVDLLIGQGGYNTVHEALATNTPLLARAQPRVYDRQESRLSGDGVTQFGNDAEALALARCFIEEHPSARESQCSYDNGVGLAVEEIKSLANQALRR